MRLFLIVVVLGAVAIGISGCKTPPCQPAPRPTPTGAILGGLDRFYTHIYNGGLSEPTPELTPTPTSPC